MILVNSSLCFLYGYTQADARTYSLSVLALDGSFAFLLSGFWKDDEMQTEHLEVKFDLIDPSVGCDVVISRDLLFFSTCV